MANRIDLGRLRAPRKLADGRVIFDAHITKAGVFEYLNPDGSIRRELRRPEQVFSPKTMASASLLTVTSHHPPDPLDAKTAKKYAVGATGETAVRDDDHVRTTVMVNDAETLAKMERYPEVSCGYACDTIERGGVDPVYGRYDAEQVNIEYNHLAVAVPVARAGSTARVRMDGASVMLAAPDAVYDSATTFKGDQQMKDKDLATLMSQLTAAEQRATTAEGLLSTQTARADAAEGRVAGLEKDVIGLRSQRTDADVIAQKDDEIAKLKTRVDSAERSLVGLPERIVEGVKRRVDLERKAAIALPDLRMDALTDREIMVETVSKIHGVAIEAERSDDYARARFDAAIESFKAGHAALARLGELANPNLDTRERADAAPVPSATDAWKQPLPSSKMKV